MNDNENVFLENDDQDTNDEAVLEPDLNDSEPEAAFEEPDSVLIEDEPVEELPKTSTGKKSPYADSPYQNYGEFTGKEHTANRMEPLPRKIKPKAAGFNGKVIRNRIVAAVLAAAMVAGGCMITARSVNAKWEAANKKTVTELTEKINALQKEIAETKKENAVISGQTVSSTEHMTPSQVYALNVNSVVGISSTIRSTSFYGQTTEGSATGSGFILTEDGYVVTNYHVVEGAVSTAVVTNDGEEYPAAVVGHDSVNDVAVLKIEAENLPAVKLGSSEDLIIGDMVVAIGNPLGQLTATQTVGYVSGKNREVTTDNSIISMIQTDAAINSGNSGGPLFNMKGEVVGITTAKYSGTTNSGASIEGIGFAIPIDDVMNIIGDLRDFGYVTGAYLGVSVQNTDAASAALYGLPTGARVVEIVDGASADRAGVHVKDIIIGLGDYEVSNVTQLTRALRHFKAGDETVIKVIRNGQTVSLKIILDEKPQDFNSTPVEESTPEGDFDEWYDYFRRYFGEG